MNRALILSLLFLAATAFGLAASPAWAGDFDTPFQVEKSGGWESYVIYRLNPDTLVYEAGLPDPDPNRIHRFVVGLLPPDCRSNVFRLHYFPAPKNKFKDKGLPGTVTAGDQVFKITYDLEGSGAGLYIFTFNTEDEALIQALATAPSAELDFTGYNLSLSVNLGGFAGARARAESLCREGRDLYGD